MSCSSLLRHAGAAGLGLLAVSASAGRSGTFGLRVVEASAVTDAQWQEGRRQSA